jgi:hypothetical protein
VSARAQDKLVGLQPSDLPSADVLLGQMHTLMARRAVGDRHDPVGQRVPLPATPGR